ncbi:MAG TPA: glycosyltransferase family 39 protein [Hyphomonadaceae bacterium]|nr:glycosyltransferase family 39 protein [Hyphomonadaceae bacterium]
MASFDRLIESRWAYAILAGLVFLLALPGLFALPTLDRDEGRFAEASSEMMESGDYVVIRYHDELRNKKPVAIHWFQSVAVSATSGPGERNIAEYRLPSMLGAILAAIGTLWAGGALFSRRAAFIGALLIGTTLLLTTEANIAKTDAAQCGILVLGMGALAHIRAGRGGKWHGVLFWVCLSLGVLLKGPIAPLVCFSTIAALFLWERKYEWAKPLLYWVGLSLFCVMTIPWYIAVQVATQGDFLDEAVRVDLGQKLVDAAEGHAGPPGMHTAALPILFWPGTLLLIPGIWLAVTKLWPRKTATGPETTRTATAQAWEEREAMAWRFVACWVVPSWIVFEIAPTKLVHYTLPMYPALALMAGAAADRWFSTNDWKQGRWVSIALFGVVTAVLAFAASPWALSAIRADAASDFGVLADRVAATWTQAWDSTGLGLWPTLLILAAAGGTIYALVRKSPIGLMAGLVACSAIGGIGYRAVVLPNQSWMLSTNASLSALKEICALPEGSQQWRASGCEGRAPKIIRAISFAEPSLVFELGNKITLPPDTTTEIPSIAEDNRPAWLINVGDKRGKKALGELVEAAAAADRCIRLARRYAFNYSNGDPSVLVAAVVEPGGCPSGETTPDLRPSSEEEDAPELDR